MLRSRLIRVSHAEVDNVLPPATRLGLELGGDIEHVRRKAFNAWKLDHMVVSIGAAGAKGIILRDG